MSVLSLHNVTKRFGEFTAVDDLSFETPEGKIFGFLGRNGAGKTTTLRMVLDILRPTSGEIVVLFVSAVVSGLGFGLAFLGAVATASAGVAPHERAGLLSSVFVVGYLSFSVPAIIAGTASSSVGLETVTEVYAAVLIVLALTAVAGMRLRRRQDARPAAEAAPEEAEALAA